MDQHRYFDPAFEQLSHDEVVAAQWQLLQEQVRRASGSPFYREKLGVPAGGCLDVASADDFAQLPLTRKDELLADVELHPPYGSRSVAAPEQLLGVVETSGTSGKGKEVHPFSTADRERIVGMEGCGFRWAGVRPGSVVALTLPIATGAAGVWWYHGLDSLGANTLRIGNVSTEEKLEYMIRFGANVVVGTPAYVRRLEAKARARGIDLSAALPDLEAIIVAGESKSAAWAAERELAWGAQFYEQWGCSAGGVLWNCEGGMRDGDRLRMLHNLPQWNYLEVIDPQTGRHVEDGEFGEIVVTPLRAHGSPVLRFATGDRARYRSWRQCSCGRPFDGVESASISRNDDMVKVKGVNIWPSAVEAVVDELRTFDDHSVSITCDDEGRERIELRLKFVASTPRAERYAALAAAEAALKSRTGVRFVVTEAGDGDRLETTVDERSGKTRRWRDLRNTTPTKGSA